MRIKKVDYLSFAQKLIIALLFLASMNFLQKCFYFIYAAFLVTVIFRYKRFKLDIGTAILAMFSVSYILFCADAHSDPWALLRQFSFPMCYLIGLNFMPEETSAQDISEDKEKALKTAVIMVGMGSFLHYLLNMITNIGSLNRNTIDIWTGEVMSATGQALMAAIAVGIFSAILFSARKTKSHILALIGFGFVLSYNMILAGRTLIFLTLVTVTVAFFYTQKNSDQTEKRKKIAMIIGIVCTALIVYICDFLGIRTLVRSSNLFGRFENIGYMEDNIRLEIRMRYLELAPKYLFGGGKIRDILGYYAHDMYLDAYNEAGIFGALFLIVFSIYAAVQGMKVLKRSNLPQNFKTLILCVCVSLYVIFLLEPILNAMPWMFCIFCFYQGLLNREYFRMET